MTKRPHQKYYKRLKLFVNLRYWGEPPVDFQLATEYSSKGLSTKNVAKQFKFSRFARGVTVVVFTVAATFATIKQLGNETEPLRTKQLAHDRAFPSGNAYFMGSRNLHHDPERHCQFPEPVF